MSGSVLSFGRYRYERDDLLREAEAAGKPAAVLGLLGRIALVDLAMEARAESELNPVDDEAGWDETSILLAAATSLAEREGSR